MTNPFILASSGQTSSGSTDDWGGSAVVPFGGTVWNVGMTPSQLTPLSAPPVNPAISVNSGQTLYVSSGHTSSSIIVLSGGTLDVLSGGKAIGSVVHGGGKEYVSSGGNASGTTVSSGGAEYDNGTTVSTVVRGGNEYVSGTASGSVVSSGGAVWNYGTTIGTVVSSGGSAHVLRTASATVVMAGGAETVASGGRDVGGRVSGYLANISVSGGTSGMTVAGGAWAAIQSGGITISTTVTNASGYVYSGGKASATVLSSGGILEVYSGGTATNTTIVDNALVQVTGGSISGTTAVLEGTIIVGAGGKAVNTNLGFFSTLDVYSGGTASNVALTGNFADLEIESGATVAGSIGIAARTMITIGIGGTAMPAAVISGFDGVDGIDLYDVAYDPKGSVHYSAGKLTVSEGGKTYALNVTSSADYASGKFYLASDGFSGTNIAFLNASSHIVSSGQTSHGIAVPGDAYLRVENGGTSVAATLSGAGPFMTYQPSTSDGGTLLVNTSPQALGLEVNQGTDSGTHVGLGGNLVNAGLSVSATVASGGVLFTVNATVRGAVIATGGIELEEGYGLPTIASGSIINGGLQGVAGGAVAIGSVVNSGGELVLGGKANIGGTLTLLPGGIASATAVNAGGWQFVNLSASASATKINSGGNMVVNSGGTASSTVVKSGGTELVRSGGIDRVSVVSSGGLEFISSAGTLSGGSVITGGKITVFSGGNVLHGLTISGGTALVSGTVAAGQAVTFAGPGGKLAIGSQGVVSAVISGFGTGDRIDLGGFAFSSSGVTSSFKAVTSTLTVSSGGKTVNLTLAGSYVASNFALGTDGTGGTLVTFHS
jgi:autotransporter passenger strand-loop-strand repeat protein